jgi:hypothetical protein
VLGCAGVAGQAGQVGHAGQVGVSILAPDELFGPSVGKIIVFVSKSPYMRILSSHNAHKACICYSNFKLCCFLHFERYLDCEIN